MEMRACQQTPHSCGRQTDAIYTSAYIVYQLYGVHNPVLYGRAGLALLPSVHHRKKTFLIFHLREKWRRNERRANTQSLKIHTRHNSRIGFFLFLVWGEITCRSCVCVCVCAILCSWAQRVGILRWPPTTTTRVRDGVRYFVVVTIARPSI